MTDLNDSDKNWSFVHTLMKSTITGVMGSVWYTMRNHTVLRKQDFKSNEIKRLIAAWDLAFDRWETKDGYTNYRKGSMYKRFLQLRNITFTFIDKDGAYLKLLYQLLTAVQETKDDDCHLTSESEELGR